MKLLWKEIGEENDDVWEETSFFNTIMRASFVGKVKSRKDLNTYYVAGMMLVPENTVQVRLSYRQSHRSVF